MFSWLSSATISVPQSFTNGAGFYLAAGKEVVSDMRKIVLKDKETGEFIDNFSSAKGKGIVSIAATVLGAFVSQQHISSIGF